MAGTVIKAFRIEVEEAMYFLGSAIGDGAGLEDGHSRVKPAGSCGSGVTRKLRLETVL